MSKFAKRGRTMNNLREMYAQMVYIIYDKEEYARRKWKQQKSESK